MVVVEQLGTTLMGEKDEPEDPFPEPDGINPVNASHAGSQPGRADSDSDDFLVAVPAGPVPTQVSSHQPRQINKPLPSPCSS